MKKNVIRLLRILVSVALLAWVLHRADLGRLADRIASARVEWLLLAFAVNSVGNLFGAWRWKLLLRSQQRDVRTPYLFGSYMVGLFFNNFLPSTIGGDVVRAASTKKKSGGTLTEHLTVVLVERMIGLFATLTLGGVAAFSGVAGRMDPRIPWMLGGALVISMLGIYLAISRRVRARARPLVDRVPFAFVRETFRKMIDAFEMFSRARPTLAANYGLSLSFQLLLILHFWIIQFAFDQSVSLATFLVVIPLVFCVMILPIGINGLGVRETALVWFMTRPAAGMAGDAALAISLASYAIAVTQGLLGGGVHLFRELRRAGEGAGDNVPTTPEG